MRFLITSARAPVALDLADKLFRDGHQVILTDSLAFPLGRFSHAIERYIRLPCANQGAVYAQAVLRIVDEMHVDKVIPVFEEIFHLSQHLSEPWLKKYAIIPERSLLMAMHDKYRFLEKVKGLGVNIPKTQRITHKQQIGYGAPQILKPTTSRFGNDVILDVTSETTQDLTITEQRPWVLQEKLDGNLLCTYSFAHQGKMLAHTNYKPRYILNNAGSNYFVPFVSKKLHTFCQKFIEKYQWHGHIAFDFIETDQGIYVIECNPRMTSGFHLIYDVLDCHLWPFQARKACAPVKKPMYYRQTLLWFFAWPAIKQKRLSQLRADCRQGQDVLRRHPKKLPFYAPTLSLVEFYGRMLRHRQSFAKSTVMDIEWNG